MSNYDYLPLPVVEKPDPPIDVISDTNNNNNYSYAPPPKTDPIMVDDQPHYIYDGDTIVNSKTGDRTRFANFDTGELSRIGEHGELHLGNITGPLQKAAVNDIIKEKGFDRFVEVPNQDRLSYGRKIRNFANAEGETLADYLHEERLVETSKWSTKEQVALSNLGALADIVDREGQNLNSADKARALIDSVANPTNRERVEAQGTFDQVYLGSAQQSNAIIATINELSAKLASTTDPEERKVIEEEIGHNRDALSYSINLEPTALSTGEFDPFFGGRIEGDPNQRKGSWWGESVNAGEKSLYMLSNTMGGFSAWLGDAIDNERLEEWGDDWALEANKDIYDAGYTTDFWSIRGPYDALRFISSSIIQYTPQMGVIWGGTMAGAAAGSFVPVIGTGIGGIVGGTTTAFMMAVSSVYQGQPEGEKDPLMAGIISLPIALADKIGFLGVAKVNPFTKAGKKEWIDIVTKPKKDGGKLGWSKKEAEDKLKNGIAEIMKETAGVMSDSVSRQLLARKTFRDLVISAGKAGAGEGLTEGVQQAIEEMGLAATTSINLDYEQLVYNTIEAMAVGGVVGTGFNVPFSIREMDKHNDYIWNNAAEDMADRSQTSLWEEDHRKRNNNKKLTKTQVADKYRGKVVGQSLEELRDRDEKTSAWSDFLSAMKNPIRFVQAYRGFLSKNYTKKNGKSNSILQELGDLLDHIQLFSGVSVAQEYRSLESNLNKLLPSRADMSSNIGLREGEIYKYIRMDDATLGKQGLSDSTVDGILKVKTQLSKLGAAIQVESGKRKGIQLSSKKGEKEGDWLKKFNSGLYFLKPMGIDYRKVDQGFKNLLSGLSTPSPFKGRPGPKLNKEDIDQIMEEISQRNISLKTRDLLSSMGVFNRPEFDKYLSQNLYEDVTSFLRTLSKDMVMQTRFGKNGEVFANALEYAHRSGEISEQQKYSYATMFSDYIDMNKGQYKPIKNKIIRAIQDNVLFFGTLTYMDFNFFANMAEMTNGLIGLSPKEMFTYMKDGSVTFVKQFGLDLRRGAALTGVVSDKTKRQLAEDDIRFERGVLAGTIAPRGTMSYLEGVDTSTPRHQNFLNMFWIWNQVESQTNSVRSARSALAWDKISQMVAVVSSEVNGVVTRKTRAARDDLIFYGLDPDRLAYLYNKGESSFPSEVDLIKQEPGDKIGDTALTKAEQDELKNYYKTGLIRFTDELVVRPEPGSTPKIIENPHFALFTQFKRFIAHFTANVIPRAWRGYLTSGKPKMSRQMFTVIMASYAMAMLSQMMKDYIVYGEQAPWLEDDEEDPDWLRTSYSRAASYTGWGGTPFMAVEFINEFNRNAATQGPMENIFGALIGESPMLNTIYSDLNSKRTLMETVAKRTPFLGDIKQTREAIGNSPTTIAEMLSNIGK